MKSAENIDNREDVLLNFISIFFKLIPLSTKSICNWKNTFSALAGLVAALFKNVVLNFR